MADLAPVLSHLDSDADQAVERLFELLRCQSISTDPAYDAECQKAAEWLATDLNGIGFEARVAETPGQPIVVAHDLTADGPHLMFYGHYDVQPVDPLNLWDSEPFDPAVRTRDDGSRYISGRGSSDDKGQLMTFVEACRAHKAVHGALPCKVTILLEGEEESGGASLPPFLDANRDELTADIALICDTGMWDARTPAITTMLRGNFAEEVTVKAASRDLHSGMYGSAAANPIHILTRILAEIHDGRGKVTIPGFYDGIEPLPNALKEQWEALGFDHTEFLGDVGLSEPAGETAYTALEQIWSRPTAEVNGIWGGYTGAGFKTVIPAEASAKISFRLVGKQDPETIRAAFREFVTERLPADCKAEFVGRPGGVASVMPVEDPAFEKARGALSDEWETEAAFIGEGGSIPVVGLFKEILDMDSLLIGFGLKDDCIHSPNEKYELRSFTKGARSWARVLAALGA
ncbi:MAG: M20/M25/M40 family metallo-hydrolase [Paracoccaceae bacterium]|nr:M20/M25/M40 family metallo-hydrolase [Paracoccaceae bacterium]